MNKTVVGVIAFSVGAAIGSVMTWRLLKTTYERITREEVESVKEYYKVKHADEKEEEEVDEAMPEEDKEVLRKGYSSIVSRYISPDGKQQAVELASEPYVIDPALYGEEDYEPESLTYYADDILTDDKGNIVDDADYIVGSDFAEHFGDYEIDCVHIRNDNLKRDYEIIMTEVRYSDIRPDKPHQMEAEWGEGK